MTTLNLSLTKSQREFVEAQVAEGGYGSASEFIQTLIEESQKQKAREKVEALLREGLNSGDPIEVTPEYWEKKRRRLAARHGEAKAP